MNRSIVFAGLVALVAGCAPDGAPPSDCAVVAAHAAALRVEPRVARAPARDRAKHRQALVRAVTPAARDACEVASDDLRSCQLAATTVDELDACGAEVTQ